MQMDTRQREHSHANSPLLDEKEEDKKCKRTRTGCLNCRKKRRKCDEGKPVCLACRRKDETCLWGMRVTFKAENAQTVMQDHPSVDKQDPTPAEYRTPKRFRIMDVTSEVIRDYHQFSPSDEFLTPDATSPSEQAQSFEGEGETATTHHIIQTRHPSTQNMPVNGTTSAVETATDQSREKFFDMAHSSLSHTETPISLTPTSSVPLNARESTENNHHWLRHILQPRPNTIGEDHVSDAVESPLPQSFPGYWDSVYSSPDVRYEDGIFLPGSEYLELHSTLRNHLILEVKSCAPTRRGTPDYAAGPFKSLAADEQFESPVSAETGNRLEGAKVANDNVPSELSKEDEYLLWKNWLDEISPWLDKFDNEHHFQYTLPIMARSHDHLRYSMLALSARQLELKHSELPIERSLLLYHQAIHLLLPQLPTRSTAVIASCVVLCVLEMLSCAPKAWQRHLDGCASLMQAVGINGFVGGVEQALFWCFARMDVCGGLISSTKTLIPISRWVPGVDLDNDISLFQSTTAYNTYANHAVYLLAQVLDLVAPFHLLGRAARTRNSPGDRVFADRWLKLWRYVCDWEAKRPETMKPIMSTALSSISPFPTVLYSNPAGISGNQLYHTAAMLMLQTKPSSLRLDQKPHSILWHARQICGISMSNDHHGAWTNSIQPLWIAGQWMSHPSEHQAIADLLKKIEKESGWRTTWRVEDLQEFWGDLTE